METSIVFWIVFNVIILTMLVLDLGVFNKRAHKIAVKEALIWSAVWITLALAFNVFVLIQFGKTKALEFLTGYVVEYSLSVDNIFIFVLVLTYFAIPSKYQHRILFYGILGALVFRAVFITLGSVLMRIHWLVLLFGAFL